MEQSVPLIVFVSQTAAALVLVLAGGSKLAEPAPIRGTIQSLGLGWSSTLASLLSLLELGAGLALLLLPGRWLTALWIVALAFVFASAAVLALIRNMRLECACFGSSASAPLGWRQLALTPVWLLLAASVIAIRVDFPDYRLALVFGVILFVSIRTTFSIVPLLIEHRTQRAAIEGS